MKKVCCRCNKDMGEVPDTPGQQDLISHGYCDDCAEQLIYESLGTPLQDFLDSLGAPVLLIEPGPRVRTANSMVCEFLGKDLEDIQGEKGGDVIECTYARTPEGCGEEVHCKSCTIRNTVLHTFATGESCENVPAYRDIYVGEDVKHMEFHISTEKVGEMVLLRIDDVRVRDPETEPELEA